jgi:hypothetical protein
MSRCNVLTRALAAVALAAAVFAGPAAADQVGRERAALAQERYYGSFGIPAQDLRSPDSRDAAEGRRTIEPSTVPVTQIRQPAAEDDGIAWVDAGLFVAALLALGGTTAVLHRRHGRHAAMGG